MSNISFYLEKKIIITGFIKVITGLHIGGNNNAMSIGGVENTVIRNPIDNKPYIPGSSLKGKMRALLEISHGYIEENSMGKSIKFVGTDDPDCITTVLFGSARGGEKQRPSRIIVRDGRLLNSVKFNKTELPYTEAKMETVIDRVTSAAMPRPLERVPAGAIFSLELIINIFKDDKLNNNKIGEKELIDAVFCGLRMVEDDYLGGSGSRGSGKVHFKIKKMVERSQDFYKKGANEQGQEKDISSEYKKSFPAFFEKKDQHKTA